MPWYKAFSPMATALFCLIASVATAEAQSTNAAPILTYNDTPFDPSTLSILTSDSVQAYNADVAALKTGDVRAFVFTASTDGKGWSAATIGKATPVYTIAGVARESLETCEYVYGGPCLIMSINGHDTQRPGGGWDAQPRMFTQQPVVFNAGEVPFVPDGDRVALASYATTAGNRALVLTTTGGWLYRNGDTMQKAIDSAFADCATSFKNQYCLLYAVNDRIVFESN